MATPSFAEILEEGFRQARDMDAPLGVRLQTFADVVRSTDPRFAGAVDRLVFRLQQSGAGATAPDIGDVLPSFFLADQDGHLVSLDQLLNKGPVAVAFHRGHWCPYCRLNANALAQVHGEVAASGGQLVAITPDLQHFASELKEDARVPFPILTDLDNAYALELNLAIWVGEEMQNLIATAGWDLAVYQGNGAWMLPIPATFVIGTDGIIRARFVDPDYRTRMAVEDIIAAIKAC